MQSVSMYCVGCCLLTLASIGCGSKTSEVNACIDNDAKCGAACNSSHPCAAGLYCGSDSLCAKSCTDEQGCPSNQHCSGSGRCAPGAAQPVMETPSDAGGAVDNPGLIGDAGSTPPQDSGYLAPKDCLSADVSSTRVIPTVVLVIDQSGSMTEKFGSGTRWTVLRDFLLRPDGLIASLQQQVRFGIALYSATEASGNTPQKCPLVTSVAPAIGNYDAISKEYTKAVPIKETPTGDSIDAIVAALPPKAPDQDNGPVVLVLATDGEPDRCEELNPQNGQAEAIASVQHAFSAGIRTFIISVGDEISKVHQQDMANAGVGHKMGDPNAPYWTSADDATLRAALTEIIAGQVSCDVTLKGTVQGGDPCQGTVVLNTAPLICKDKDGWELADSKHIRLLGKACDDFKNQPAAVVHASFPCGVPVVF